MSELFDEICGHCDNDGCEDCMPSHDDLIDCLIEDALLLEHHPELT